MLPRAPPVTRWDLHLVLYDDGDAKWHDLGHEELHGQLCWLDAAATPSPKKRKRLAAEPAATVEATDARGVAAATRGPNGNALVPNLQR